MGPFSLRTPRWATVMAAILVAASACSWGEGDSNDGADGTDDATIESTPHLEIRDESSEVYCDGTEQPVGEIHGAEPGERLMLSSPRPIELTADQAAATADADGAYQLNWRCSSSEAGQPWELRVEGQDSGRRLTVSVVGIADDPDLVGVLAVTVEHETFPCDGESRDLAQVTNAEPWETVTLGVVDASTRAPVRLDDTIDRQADGDGALTLSWHCSPDQATTWEFTAEAPGSGRVGQFTMAGVAPSPEEMRVTVQIVEDPFVCDGGTRVFGTLSGFVPGEKITFDSPQASLMHSGDTEPDGSLPIRWTCDAADAAKVWEVTATGDRSQRTVTFTVTGAAPPPAPDPAVSMTEDPFRCDGSTRFVATITGFAPREYVDFTSPQVEHLRQGQADDTGALPIRWTCDAADAAKVWEVTATGATSARSVTFRITGQAGP